MGAGKWATKGDPPSLRLVPPACQGAKAMRSVGHIEGIDDRRFLNWLFETESKEDCMAVLEASQKVCELCGKRWMLHGAAAGPRSGGGFEGSFLLKAYEPILVAGGDWLREVMPYEKFDVAALIDRLNARFDPYWTEPEAK